MPFTIHEEAVKKQMQYNVARPQEAVPADLPESWMGTLSGGLPVKQIHHLEYPRLVYLHPQEAFQTIEHRNDRFEIVSTDFVPTEHRTKLVRNEQELSAALDDGWVREPYIPKGAPSPSDAIYAKKRTSKAKE